MDNTEALSRILSVTCSNPSTKHYGWNDYTLDTHCGSVVITARPSGEPVYEGFWDHEKQYLYTPHEVLDVRTA